MSITLNSSNGFEPTSAVGNKFGLHWQKGSTSSATLNGTGLVNGLTVTVLFPSRSPNPQIEWTGITSGSSEDNTQCTVNPLTEQKSNNGPGAEADTDITVSVTATNTTTNQSSNTVTPNVPTGS
jgi:hypothetical protein